MALIFSLHSIQDEVGVRRKNSVPCRINAEKGNGERIGCFANRWLRKTEIPPPAVFLCTSIEVGFIKTHERTDAFYAAVDLR